jgi:hypothetical protein
MKFDQPIKNFKDLVNAIEAHEIQDEIFLPVTHIPKWVKLGKILEDMHLEPFTGNKHFEDEPLVFFTYGRNVYMPKSIRKAENEAYPPYVFVFDLATIEHQPTRILPFDSGGFDFYGMEEGLEPQHFQIPQPGKEDVKKLVYALFKNYKRYLEYDYDFKELVDDAVHCRYIKALCNLYDTQSNTTTEIGKQSKSIEFQYEHRIALNPIVVVYPHTFLTRPNAIQQMEALFPNAETLYYQAKGNPHVHIENINEKLKEYINGQTKVA